MGGAPEIEVEQGMNVGASGNSSYNALAMFRRHVMSYARIGASGGGHNFSSVAQNVQRQMRAWKQQAATGRGATSELLRKLQASKPHIAARPKFLVNRDVQSRPSRINIQA